MKETTRDRGDQRGGIGRRSQAGANEQVVVVAREHSWGERSLLGARTIQGN